MVIALFVYLLALVCWLGGMVFFTAIVAPVVFTLLPLAEAGKLVSRGFLPRFYILGYIAGVIGLVLGIYFAVERPSRLWWSLSAVALAAALGLTLYTGAIVRPQVDALRSVVEEQNPDPVRRAEFDRLHHLSVMLSGGVMLLNLVTLFTTAAALTPKG